MSLNRISLVIWLAGVMVRLVLVFPLHRYELFRPEVVKIAISLAKTGNFADPFSIPTGYTAHIAPVYPLVISPLYRLLGDTSTADFARIVLSIAVAAVSYALLPFVATAIRMSASVGIVAGLTGALLPSHFWPESMGETEAAFSPVFIELTVILFAGALIAKRFSVSSGTRAGMWCGIGLLLSPALSPVFAGLGGLAIFKFRPRIWRWIAGVLFGTLVAIAPWTIRNYARMGSLFFIRDNFGLELYISNQDNASPELEWNDISPFFVQEHPFLSIEAAQEIAQRGEVAFERERFRRAKQWIKTHPRRFLALTGARVWNFWFNPVLPGLARYLMWSLTLTALAGWILLLRRNPWAAAVLGSILVTFPLVYYIVENGMRYEYPIYWVKLLLSGNVAIELWSRFATSSRP